jgi:hypothetical protein
MARGGDDKRSDGKAIGIQWTILTSIPIFQSLPIFTTLYQSFSLLQLFSLFFTSSS